MQHKERSGMDSKSPEVLNREKQMIEQSLIRQSKLDSQIQKIIQDSCKKLFEFYKGKEYLNDQLRVLFEVTKGLNYSESEINAFRANIEAEFKDIEYDLGQAMQHKGLQNYYKFEFKKLKDKNASQIVNFSPGMGLFFIDYDIIFKIIFDKYNIEYIKESLHLIDIARDYRNIITICLFHHKEKLMK